MLFCDPPPGIDGTTFNEETYQEGGLKYREAEEARWSQQEKEAKLQGQAKAPQGIDGDFFSAASKEVKAKTRGKFKTGDFARTATFPHQSGYIMAAPSAYGGSTVSAMTETFDKKSHKNGKRRVKDRTWKA